MSEILYCKQCSHRELGRNTRDFAGLLPDRTPPYSVEANAACGVCGGSTFTHSGRCVDAKCGTHGAGTTAEASEVIEVPESEDGDGDEDAGEEE